MLYAPLLHAYAMKRGLQDADAADLVQETLKLVLRAAPEFIYQPEKGSFRGWLLTVTRNVFRKFANRRAIHEQGTGDSDVHRVIDAVPAPTPDDEAEWNQEYRAAMFHAAAKRIEPEFRPGTWQAFWRTAVLGESCESVAAAMAISIGAVYIARSRVTGRLRQEIALIGGDDL